MRTTGILIEASIGSRAHLLTSCSKKSQLDMCMMRHRTPDARDATCVGTLAAISMHRNTCCSKQQYVFVSGGILVEVKKPRPRRLLQISRFPLAPFPKKTHVTCENDGATAPQPQLKPEHPCLLTTWFHRHHPVNTRCSRPPTEQTEEQRRLTR